MSALGRDMEPLRERPGYNHKPTDWVRYANHLEAVEEAAREFVEAHRATEWAWTDRMDAAFTTLRNLVSEPPSGGQSGVSERPSESGNGPKSGPTR